MSGESGQSGIGPGERALIGQLVEGRVRAVFRWGVIVELGSSQIGFIDALYVESDEQYAVGDTVRCYVSAFDDRKGSFWLRPPDQVPIHARFFDQRVRLTREEFWMLRQVALQFSEISSGFLRTIRADDDDVSAVWDILRAAAEVGAVETVMLSNSAEAGQAATCVRGNELDVRLSKPQYRLLCHLGLRVLHGFGDRELYYRTGCDHAQIKVVVDKICQSTP